MGKCRRGNMIMLVGVGCDSWCNGKHVCISSLPPILECGFESQLGLEFSVFSMWHFHKLVVRGFLRVLWFPPLLHRLMVSANKIKLQLNKMVVMGSK